MKIFGIKIAGVATVALLAFAMMAQPGRLAAQGTASVHGHVLNPAGMALTAGEVRLTTNKSPSGPNVKFDYSFPIDGSGNYKGTDVKPGSYIAVVFQQGLSVDFMPTTLAAGDDKTVDIDMSRKEYIDKMSPADRAALEEYKKNAAATMAQNAKIENLNALLKSARADNDAHNYDAAIKAMTDATAAKPDEAVLWETLGDAQLGAANAAAKTARDNKTTDASVPDKFAAAETSYLKALDLTAKSPKPDPKTIAAANNQLGQAYGRTGKTKESSDAYEAAAKADPPNAGMYYFNEAATLFNANAAADAATAADKAITADPNKVEAYYIKAESLAPNITTTPTGKYVAPPGLVDACNKYLELAPTGPHAQDMKDLLTGLGEKIQTTYKAPKK